MNYFAFLDKLSSLALIVRFCSASETISSINTWTNILRHNLTKKKHRMTDLIHVWNDWICDKKNKLSIRKKWNESTFHSNYKFVAARYILTRLQREFCNSSFFINNKRHKKALMKRQPVKHRACAFCFSLYRFAGWMKMKEIIQCANIASRRKKKQNVNEEEENETLWLTTRFRCN